MVRQADPFYGMEFAERRRQAMTRDCPDCPAKAGEECVNQYTGRTLGRWPAHARRERPEQ